VTKFDAIHFSPKNVWVSLQQWSWTTESIFCCKTIDETEIWKPKFCSF
jgi:hypothetical protein